MRTTHISVRLPHDLCEVVTQHCLDEDCTASQLIRRSLRAYLGIHRDSIISLEQAREQKLQYANGVFV